MPTGTQQGNITEHKPQRPKVTKQQNNKPLRAGTGMTTAAGRVVEQAAGQHGWGTAWNSLGMQGAQRVETFGVAESAAREIGLEQQKRKKKRIIRGRHQ
jgi:hypothetical protein